MGILTAAHEHRDFDVFPPHLPDETREVGRRRGDAQRLGRERPGDAHGEQKRQREYGVDSHQ